MLEVHKPLAIDANADMPCLRRKRRPQIETDGTALPPASLLTLSE
jgi:hypothetical protein